MTIFDEPIPKDLVENVQGNLSPENTYLLSDTVTLFRGFSATPDMKNLLEMSEHGNTGVVFRLNCSYSGNHYEKLWEWLKEGR